jgi:hypothetical protein
VSPGVGWTKERHVTPLRASVTDSELIEFVDTWAGLMEREEYDTAYALTAHDPAASWTPALLREVVKSYGEARETQRVTVAGAPTDITQRKEVDRWEPDTSGEFGEIWYDLNIDGLVSDLTATFRLVRVEAGVLVRLNDIHVM